MINRLFKPKPKASAPAYPAVPDGSVVWAVGDVHGCLDLLQPLVTEILHDAAATSASRKLVIFLGDYIDRGPDSAGVVRFLASMPANGSVEWRFLRGNHEETMLNFLSDPSVGQRWCEYGGEATLRSYGLRKPDLAHRSQAWGPVSADLDHALTPGDRAFLDRLELSIEVGDYFFSHAGARPGVSLVNQTAHDLMWIRHSFLDSEVEFDRVIIHGHTPVKTVHADRRRVCVDTKAYASGVLTALRLEGRERRLLQATLSGSGDTEGPAVHVVPLDVD